MQKFIGNRISGITCILAMLIVSGCASTSDTPTPAVAKSESSAATDEVVTSTMRRSGKKCRMRRVTGSHIATEQCFTSAQLEQMEQDSKSLLRTGGSRGGAYRIPSDADPRQD